MIVCPVVSFLLVIVLSVLQITASYSPFGIFKLFLSFFCWLLCCLAFKLRLLIAPLASSNFSCPFSFGYCVICPSSNYASDSPLASSNFSCVFFFWLLCYLSFFDLRLLIVAFSISTLFLLNNCFI